MMSVDVSAERRHAAMETLWNEVRSIDEEEQGDEERDEDEEDTSHVDEAELEEAWLVEAGLSSLLAGSSSGEGPAEALLSTLSRQQAATVRKKLDQYNHTMRKKNRQPITHVQDLFNITSGDDSPCPTPPSKPKRYHKSTKTIHKHRGRPTFPSFTPIQDQITDTDTDSPTTDTNSTKHTHSPTTDTNSTKHTHSPTTDTNSTKHTHSPTHTHSPSDTHSPTGIAQLECSHWLLRDTPYSEGVFEGGACVDCHCLNGDNNPDVPCSAVLTQQGVTAVADLSSADMSALAFISFIELTTMYHNLGIHQVLQIPRIPRILRTRDKGVFGVPLSVLLENDRKSHPGVKVPLFLTKLLSILEQRGLKTEGILRVPGSAARLKALREQIDRCAAWVYEVNWEEVRQADAAGLLKLFIRELPLPLLTSRYLPAYAAVPGLSCSVHQIQALQLLTMLLPEAHRDTLKVLLQFLRQVVNHERYNRMSLWNVAMVIAPNLFHTCRRHANGRRWMGVVGARRRQEEDELAMMADSAHLVKMMIKYQDVLFMVPCFLLSQLRRMNGHRKQETVAEKTKRRVLGRKNHKNEVTVLCAGVIRVHAPFHTKVSMAMQLDAHTRVRDVMTHFDNKGDQCLFEVGGNIGERRLHENTVLLEVYRVNPTCSWILKPPNT